MRQPLTTSPDASPRATRRWRGCRRVTGRLLGQEEAARLAGCSKDTIVRARRSGRFPNARLRDRRWVIPSDDLIDAGLYRPQEATAPVEPIEADQAVEPAAVQLARALARVAALEDLVARQDDQLAFLRQLTVDTLTKRGAL
ncbi:MAG: helix-turn-helix domain-containing protein [Candidatus Saccharimonadales bacterium]